MLFSKLIAFSPLLTLVIAYPAQRDNEHDFRAPGPNDRRSPCPMVNALANHGYLPRDGFNVSMEVLVQGFAESVNLHPDATTFVGNAALEGSTTGSSNSFHLDDLNTHNIIEHDGSLSRQDIGLGDNSKFDPEIWATVVSHFDQPLIDISTAAKARLARLEAAEAANPDFDFGLTAIQASMIETALYMSMFKDGDDVARTEWVRVLFEQERLPFEEGYSRRVEPVTSGELLGLVAKIAVAGIFP